MLILERIVALYAPHCCIGCGIERNVLLCEPCRESLLLPIPSRCYRCMAVTRSHAVCGRCRRQTALRYVAAAVVYKDTAKELIHHAKFNSARAGLCEVADCMLPLVRSLPSALLVPIPTATSRVRQRGYDHSEIIAKQLARQTGLQTKNVLRRSGQTRQVGSSRAERRMHLLDAFRVNPSDTARICGQSIILIDDVLTTGATLETAARVLRRAGAKQVNAVVFAQAV